MRRFLPVLMLPLTLVGCQDSSPLLSFERDNPYDVGISEASPTDVHAGRLSESQVVVSWQQDKRPGIATVLEYQRDGGSFHLGAEVGRDVQSATIVLPGPGSYIFRVAFRLSDQSLGVYRYSTPYVTSMPPPSVSATVRDSATVHVAWQNLSTWTVAVVVERNRNEEPFVVATELSKGAVSVDLPITGPGKYTFRVAARLNDGSLGYYGYSRPITVP